MELFNLDIAEPGGEKSNHILRFPDTEWRRPGLLGQPGGQLKGGEQPGGLGRPHPGGLHQLGPRPRRESPEGAFAHFQQEGGNIEGGEPATTGAQQHRDQLN